MKKFSSATAWLLVLVLVIVAAFTLFDGSGNVAKISADKFEKYWKENKVKTATMGEDNVTIVGELDDGTQYHTALPRDDFKDLRKENPNKTAVVDFTPPTSIPFWIQMLPTFLIIIMLVAFWGMFMQQSGGGGGGNRGVMNFGKSRAKMATPDKKKVTFKDVAGEDEEKEELEEIVDFLKSPKKYIEVGARIPKGVLLVGPPGTGKTLLAKAVAGEAGVPFFSISGSDFVEMFVGVGASRVRDLFEQAKKNSPCIIFIDEIDAVGRQRGAGLGGGHDEREQTLNQLLVEMDGFGVNEGIIMVAATNRPDILDPALLRPGRFDRQIVVGAPDVKGREEILKVHSRNKPLSSDVDLGILAKRTPGFTGADIENLMNEAALLTVRGKKKIITMDTLEEAITRVIAGPEKKSRVISEKDKRLTAYHEAGHAVVSKYLPNSYAVHEISIIPRGMAGGYTLHLPDEDTTYTSRSKLKDEMVGLLGGRVAEALILKEISTGAKNDIDRTTSIAKKMVMEYGMSEKLGPISFGKEQGEVFLGRDIGHSRDFSEEIASMIDDEVRSLVNEAYKRAETILSENEDKLHEVAKALLEKEKLTAEEFNAIMDGKGLGEISTDIIKEEAPKEEESSNDDFNSEEVKLQVEKANIKDVKKEEI
ncbi:MAG: ATP-dependent zinc metalloprotease FtsH [Clostridium argentinense]|uniref:ATP-dependent zinc metalloprotease FtsH n=1 Tax=Clostridium faecium TaxID=2762223 RepID=A0ABR8YWB2_9CLOT|nr:MULTISPECIES: ATP-dependent zinc metalloprotease FtsH [Clostridium]MBD8048541.1 ATP-dependent zinc metalloprotease FtsH [Clostridium faecium]MBS5824027.1 ATP-dependent zinc metalloprotease FtsH [Clostridium argentinense]MDU1350744.1 ATP-dependent zinc metalloprotease FtsH [Clostridium argentinense]